jgi:hypothetical protein
MARKLKDSQDEKNHWKEKSIHMAAYAPSQKALNASNAKLKGTKVKSSNVK